MYKSYRIYTHRRQDFKTCHEIQGALVLLGGMLFVFGSLIMYFEIAAVGAGFLILASALSICTMKDYYEYERNPEVQDQLERGVSEADE